jgi:SAM-dependent methyltransferase
MTSRSARLGVLERVLRRSYFYPFWAVNQGIRRAVASVAGNFVGGTLVDIGCGERPYREMFRVDRYFGFDLFSSGRPVEMKLPDVWFDGIRIPVRDEAADHVVCTGVLQLVPDPRAYLHELNRILKPGGNLVFSVAQSEPVMEPPYDCYRFTINGIRAMCKSEGFEIQVARPSVGYWQTMAFHVNCMTVRSLLARSRKAAFVIATGVGFVTQSVAHLLDAFTSYNDDVNAWIVHVQKAELARIAPVKEEEDREVLQPAGVPVRPKG